MEARRLISSLVAVAVAGIILVGVAQWLTRLPESATTRRVQVIEPLSKPAKPAQDYVGSTVCAECHREIATRYQSHPMAHSLALAGQANRLEIFQPPQMVSRGPKRFFAELRDEEIIHHEQMLDDEGPIYDLEGPVKYILGSGTRGRAYLALRGSKTFQSAINWYAHGGWDLAPGTTGMARLFERAAGNDCLYCHVGTMSANETRSSDPLFTEASISCERCHGPAGEHVKVMRTGSGDAKNGHGLVSYASLDPERREAVCTQCHLLGDSIILRYGHSFFDFRPGDALHEIFTVFSLPIANKEANALGQVEQLHQSRCFQASQGRLECISCHDPHGKPGAEERESFYRNRCMACHSDQGCALPEERRLAVTAVDSCVECHMPRKAASDLPHTSMVDHRILRTPRSDRHGEPKPAKAGNSPFLMEDELESLTAFEGSDQKIPPREAARARGLAYARALESNPSRLLAAFAEPLLNPYGTEPMPDEAVFEALADDIDVLLALATVLRVTERLDQAILYWRRVLDLAPRNEVALFQLAEHYHNIDDYVEARIFIERLLEVRPDLADVQGRYAHVLSQFEEWSQAIAAAERGLALDPAQTRLRTWLVKVYERKGDHQLAEPHKRKLKRLQAIQPAAKPRGND